MNTDAHGYDGPPAQLTFAVSGCARVVLNGLGAGLHEKPCENALVVESKMRGIADDQQCRSPVDCKGVNAGEYVPDPIAGVAVIVDAKVIDRITDVERGRMLSYLKIAGLKVGRSSISSARNWSGNGLFPEPHLGESVSIRG